MEPVCSKNKRKLEACYFALEKRLRAEKNDLCRIAIIAWMYFTAKKFGGLLYKQFMQLLPYMLGLKNRDGTLKISCDERAVCYEPILCLKAYLLCRRRWMRKELEKIDAGTPYARVARVVLGETMVPKECGGMPPECVY